MIYEVRIAANSETDSRGKALLSDIRRLFGKKNIQKIRTTKIYRLEGITKEEAKKFTKKVLFEPIDQNLSTNGPIFNISKRVEVAYKPGVMNPEVGSLLKAAKDLGINLKAADSSWEYSFFGKLTKEELTEIVNRLLVNKTVEQLVNKKPKTLLISGRGAGVKRIPIRNSTEEELLNLSKDRLFLNLEEMKVIQDYFQKKNKDPTDCEVEILAQTWSEHCVHKTFKAKLTIDGKEKQPLIERIKSTAKYNKKLIVSAFEDNSGVIDFYDSMAISGKVETHNSPSAIEPYGGAMTGSGGVFRDILGTGQGAKPIASTDIFCFAPPNLPDRDIPPGCLPPQYLLQKVVYGVRDYGNRTGIPTNNGSIHFHKDFRAKPTVAVGSYGLIPKKYAQKKSPKVGDLIVTIGGRTGRDGIHGATFSSGEMTDRTINVSGSAVQIGNAIEEKRMIDAILDLRDKDLIRTLTDCGAGGYSSAIGEMGENTGAHVILETVPLKYKGLAPWEIFLSESQERMVLAIDKKNIKKVLKICELFNVEAKVIGKFDGSKRLRVTYKKLEVASLEINFLHHGLPQRHMVGKSTKKVIKEKLPKRPKDLNRLWLQILANPNVCSKEPIVRLYDHNVQGTNALHPFSGVNFDGPNDGAIIKPILNKPYGVVITHGLNPVLNKIDPYQGSIWAITEAIANFVAIGGEIKNAALIDNFIWPFPDEESLADLDKAVDACCEMAKVLNMPFVSGKDSLSSTYRFKDGSVLKIPPVLLISVFGKIDDVTKTQSSDFKSASSQIVLVGSQLTTDMAGSAYFDIASSTSAKVPKANTKSLVQTLGAITKGIKTNQILSVHDISEGGIAASLAEMSIGADAGAQIDLSKISNVRPDFIFFNETPGTFLVEVKDKKTTRKLFTKVPYKIIGSTREEKTVDVKFKNRKLASQKIEDLKYAWQRPMKEIFN